MAATGFTPVFIYSSSTGGNAPAAANLTNTTLGSELAINITDGYLYYKDNANAVQKIGYKLVPIANGGTNATSFNSPVSSINGLVWFDGTRLVNDATTSDVGYNASTNTFYANNVNYSGTLTGSTGVINIGTGQIYKEAGGAVGIGTTSPSTYGKLAVSGNAIAAVGDGNYYAIYKTDGTRYGYIQGTVNGLKINGETGAGNAVTIYTSGAETLLCDSSQNVNVKVGNVIIGTSGKGIDFSATAGTGTSELLADYEEGTWTPTIAGQSSAGTGTYTSRVGRYTKVGRAVHFTAYVAWTAHTGTGTMVLNGLPYTSDATAGVFFSFTPFNTNLTYTVNYQIALTLFNNSTTLVFYEMNNNVAANQINIDTAADIIVSGTYFV